MSGLVIAAVIAVGAGGALEVTQARTEAAGYAVTHGLVVSNLARICGQFRGQLAQDPEAALAAWRQRNAERAAAAESYLVYAATVIERQEGAAAAQAYNARTRAVFRRQANNALNDIFNRMHPQPGICARWIDAIAAGEADLNWESKYVPALDELVEFERSVRSGKVR
ncbi:MAG: hypothetical protein ACREU4_02595 [Burkholderiales bacterium]